jgi:outer membrane protein assembly factor BamA
VYYYTFSEGENVGRITADASAMGSYDSTIIGQVKLHLGLFARYFNDHRDSKIIPTHGHFINIKLQAYKGIETYLHSFAQIIPEFAIYRSLNKNHTIVVADRVGGTVSIGKPAFYQAAFIGGHENLLGFRQYRFAGYHSAYNNLELRIKIADVASYILPGQLGLTGFWDIGRVWVENDASKKWHNSVGGGIYFAPASMLSANLLAGFSEEGVYPYFTLGFRF